MSRWLIRFGCAFLALGFVLLSPLSDWLPIGLLDWGSPDPDQYIVRVVATGENPLAYAGAILTIAGVLLCAAGWLRRRQQDQWRERRFG